MGGSILVWKEAFWRTVSICVLLPERDQLGRSLATGLLRRGRPELFIFCLGIVFLILLLGSGLARAVVLLSFCVCCFFLFLSCFLVFCLYVNVLLVSY